MPHRHVSNTHSTSTFTVSRLRQKPASSMVNPACMPNTRNAATSVQTVFSGLMTGFLVMSVMSADVNGGVGITGWDGDADSAMETPCDQGATWDRPRAQTCHLSGSHDPGEA